MHTPLKAAAGIVMTLAGYLSVATLAHAGPNDYVHSPIVEEGEREIDFKLGTNKPNDGDRASAVSFGLGFGMNAWWFTEVYAKASRQAPEGWIFDAIEWENKFQLTETGKYPVDVGMVVEIERPQDRAEGWEINFGPLFQAELTPNLVTNLNLLFTRNYFASIPSEMSMSYQWQLKYRWKPELEFGAQAFGSLGPWRDWLPADQQEHKAGPAVFGKIRLDAHHSINYNAAWLLATNAATPRDTLRLQVEYEY